MKINEIIVEAGIMRGLAGAATGLAKVFNPQLGRTMQSALAQGDELTRKQAIPVPPKIQPTATTPVYAPKPLSAFGQILPKHVSVTRRDPLVIRYGTQDFTYDESARRWENLKGDPVKDIKLNQLLTAWAEEINEFDPPPEPIKPSGEPAVFTSGRQVAAVNTIHGIASKMKDGKWYLGNTPITNPADIAKLDQEARETGQIK